MGLTLVVLLHDIVRPHTARRSTHLLQEFSWEVFNHPPYSLDPTHSDFRIFLYLKKFLSGQRQRFQNVREAEMSVTEIPIPGGRLLQHRDSKVIVFPAKEDLWQSLSYVASWNGEPGSLNSYGWLRGERRACHKVITRPAGLKVPVWQLWVVSVATDCKQWPWLGFCQNRTNLVALWLDTFILCLTSTIFRSSLAHLFRDHLWVELL